MDQEKIVHQGPEYSQPSQPQYQPAMQGQPPVGTYMQQQPLASQPQPQMQMQSQVDERAYPHPTAYGQQGGEWQAGLCNCSPCTSCLLATCLPCILLGQTSERIRDPSMQSADMMNSDCMIHGLINCFTGCGWIYALMKRGEIRERYQIQGSGFNDCCVSFWCSCCALIQQDNEVKMRQRNSQPIAQGYQSQPTMHMPAPSYQP
ncbi:PLAC8-domain-containing protein [Annulohypoxylon bovei var. microspora]|nr:PLAC8-domain-containing protein [Annulohypoxylon bovei var. microspora]